MENPHFKSVETLKEAAKHVAFTPLSPEDTAGCALEGMNIFVKDHKMREVPRENRTLEMHYGKFVISQKKCDNGDAAKKMALETPYGQAPSEGKINGFDARMYELGPAVPEDDIDGRRPAAVAWHDAEMFFLIASTQMNISKLITIAKSMI